MGYSTSCQTEHNTQCKTEFEELCELMEREQCHTELDEQCHDEFVEECKTEYTEKCKEAPDCRTEWQEECDTKPKSTKWKRHAIDEMETADVEEEFLEGRRKRSLATAAAVFGAGAVKATVVGAAAGAAIGGVVLPGAIGYGIGRKVGAGAKKLVQIKSDLVQRKRDRFGRSVDELAEEEIVDIDMRRLKELSESAEEERGTAAEAISRQKRTIPDLGLVAAPVAALGAVAAAPLVAAVGAGPLVAGHFAKKLGFKAGLHHALKGKDVKQALVNEPKAKVKQDPVCKQVPVERCTTSKQCDQVPVEKCERVPVETCNQVPHQICENVPHPRCVSVPHKVCEIIPEEKCRKEPSETCWEEPVQKCHQVPEERCWQEPHQSCRDEPREICHDKTVRLEKKVCVHETKKTEVPTW